MGEGYSDRMLCCRLGLTFPSTFAVALMNTSPEEQVIDVSFTDTFRDMVRRSSSQRLR
jgi:hypothetical protein